MEATDVMLGAGFLWAIEVCIHAGTHSTAFKPSAHECSANFVLED